MNNVPGFRITKKNGKFIPEERFLFFWLKLYETPFVNEQEAQMKLQQHIERVVRK